ncbi:hypothetical protein [Polyangium jinanense]|uniref:Uncharacterized protein n=1 Tax=Polyangium jinanense TaxID=2829994 RepID=A0A9X3XDQ7_9BACT|nr:hypothetical protein [Polyangium jinanense]MDC3960449.1 hypothetical protein [Polyangium jinanense]MDC3986778.1 hypothetical protein [Polyangium jinanense]
MRIRVSAEIPLGRSNVDFGLVTWLHIAILDEDDSGPIEKPIGQARAALVHVGKVLDNEESLHDVLDADSGDLEALYSIYFDEKTDWFKPELAEGMGRDLLYIDEVHVEPAFEGRNIELAVVRNLADTLGQGCELVVVPVESDQDEEYWSHLGFEMSTPAEKGHGYMHLNLAYRSSFVDDEENPGHFKVQPNIPSDATKTHH